jgi:Domain of unknown function (DUF1735)
MKKLLFVLCSAALLTSCLKDKNYDNGVTGHQVAPQKIVELIKPNSSATSITIALDFQNLDTILTILPIRISSSEPAPNDITLTLDTSVTTPFVNNPANAASHFKLISGSIVSPLTLTIPKGSFESAPIQIKVNSISFDPSSKYAIGFKIKTISDPSYQINANYSTYYVILGAKNKFDGVYQLTGYHNRPTLTDPYDEEVHMITTGPNSVTMWWPALGNYAHPIHGGVTYYGNFTTNFIFDPATNVMVDWDQVPYGNSVTHQVYAGSYYDPATKKIYANIGYNANPLRLFFDVLTYTGPR